MIWQIKIIRHIDSIKNRKKLIASVYNEYSELQLEFDMLTNGGKAPISAKPALSNTIQRTSIELQKVNAFIAQKEKNPVKKIRKSLQTCKIEEHLKALRRIKLELQRQAGLQT